MNGITADVIEIHSFDELKKPGIAKGKIVFFNRPLDPTRLNTFEAYSDASEQRTKGPSQAAAAGAVAAIVRSMTLAHENVPAIIPKKKAIHIARMRMSPVTSAKVRVV